MDREVKAVIIHRSWIEIMLVVCMFEAARIVLVLVTLEQLL